MEKNCVGFNINSHRSFARLTWSLQTTREAARTNRQKKSTLDQAFFCAMGIFFWKSLILDYRVVLSLDVWSISVNVLHRHVHFMFCYFQTYITNPFFMNGAWKSVNAHFFQWLTFIPIKSRITSQQSQASSSSFLTRGPLGKGIKVKIHVKRLVEYSPIFYYSDDFLGWKKSSFCSRWAI